MANLVDKIGDAHKFLSVLTWKKLIQLLAFIFIMGLTWATYENREVIYGYATQKRIDPAAASQTKDISRYSKSQINIVTEKSEFVAGIQVSLADFQKNQRVPLYTYVNSNYPQLKKLYDDYVSTSIGNIPLFSDNIEDNKRLVSLINGEFVCSPFEGSLGQRILPAASQYVRYTCSSGIPASYGRFAGTITIFLSRQPKPEEFDQIRNAAKSLATMIYDNDLNK